LSPEAFHQVSGSRDLAGFETRQTKKCLFVNREKMINFYCKQEIFNVFKALSGCLQAAM